MNSIIGFVAKSIEEELEMIVPPNPRTKTVVRNLPRMLEIEESDSKPGDYEFSVLFDDRYYLIPQVSRESGHGPELESRSLCGPVEPVSNDRDGSHKVPDSGDYDCEVDPGVAQDRRMEERVSKEGTMVQRILIGIGALLAGVLITWFVANAGVGMKAPDITNQTWLNSAPLRLSDLKGKVVMVEFWTFGCYNCRNVEPYVKAWHKKYRDQGFVVIGVHSPEFNYEREIEKVQHYLRDHEIDYPVPIDNDFSTWNQYGNRYWPAMYLVDKRGVIRYVRVGEGGYDQTQRVIEALLKEGFSHEAPEK